MSSSTELDLVSSPKLTLGGHQGGGKPLHVKTTMHGVYVIHHVVILLICESFCFDIESKI
jgi:hypothetical protein